MGVENPGDFVGGDNGLAAARSACSRHVFSTMEIKGQPLAAEGTPGMIPWRLVTPHFFDVLHIPITRGRRFQEFGRRAGAPAMILSQSLARRLLPDRDPLDERVRPTRGQGSWYVVVGVSNDIRDLGAGRGPEPYDVAPLRQWPIRGKAGGERS